MKNEKKVKDPLDWFMEINKGEDPTTDQNAYAITFAEMYHKYYHSATQQADIALFTITKDGFNGIPIGGKVRGFCSGTIPEVVLKEGDILNHNYYWMTDFEYQNLVKSLIQQPPEDVSKAIEAKYPYREKEVVDRDWADRLIDGLREAAQFGYSLQPQIDWDKLKNEWNGEVYHINEDTNRLFDWIKSKLSK